MDTTSMTVEMLRALRVDDTDPLHSFAKVHPQPPGFDIGRSAVAQPRDLGYRTGDADFKFRPTLELLCFLGLQRFNPVTVTDTKDGGTYQFHVWGEPLPVSLVPAASCGILGGVEYLGAYTFQTFHVIDQPGYYAFTSANPI
jgi:CRISPR-associated protein Csb3